ncbi:synaptopodin isoform X2 [Silurus asotus]|uniref:Synaptopodin isoform X2 n=1 Tax=Silurus asotus TaxID=30991 RepID=A0AAD5FA71_SILAS|nr:synaptopodin isoform X2 [Silurus asotus]
MERGHDPVKRGISWTGQSTTTHAATILDETGTESWDKEEHNWVKAKPLLISSSGDLVQKTNLGRSASLSEKELKEARTRSQIIAAQLTVPSNCKSRGVQLFNRRRERVNAFTFTSVGGGEEGSHEEPCDELESPSPSTLTWNKECSTESRIKDFKHRRSETQLQRPTTVITSKGHKMEGAVKVANEVGDRVDERHFLPVIDNDKDEEIPEHEEAGKDVTFESDNSPVVPNPNQERQQDVQLTRAYESPLEALKAIQNGNHSTKTSSKEDNSATKQSTITNRTARPFFSPVGVTSTEAIHSPDISLTPAYSTSPPPAQYDPTAATYSKQEPLTFVKPAFSVSSRQVFSPPPPAPSYPTPPLPSYMSLPASIPTDPPPLSAMSPPPSPAYYTPLTIPSSTYANQLMADRRTVTPNRTGILEEGRGRRSNRKSMFTFQEKPKLSPNPELLSLVQTTDEKKKSRGQETHQEEEQLALGAEASNFLVKDESGVEEALVPEWASTLKSSRTQPRVEHKPEQALSSASGKGAKLFAKRQSRMEKYVHENAEGLRSPSPTTSLPPSWVYPSNMPGRVKAIINASNITAEVSKTFQAQRVTQKKNTPAKLPVPPPVQENPTLENGCTRVEMELSRHKPYQINSSLFILNPTKDPKSTLPRAAPPPKPVVMGSSYSRQTSLPSTPIPSQYDSHDYRSAHCFSPPMMPLNSVSRRVTSPMSDAAPERVTSPRSSIQAPKPTFSTKKAGITPQGKEDSLVTSHINSPSSPVPWTPNLFRRHSSTDKSPGAGWTPISQHSSLVTSPPPRTIHIPINSVASSPPAKTIHNSTTCSPISGSIHNPVTSSPTPRSIHNPISPPPNPRHFNSPVTSSANTQSMSSSPSPKPFKSSVAIISLSKPQNIHTATTPVSPPWETRGQSPIPLQDTKANHRLIAKNIINAAKRKNSLSPRALSGHGLLMSPVSSTILPFETKPQSPFQSRALGAQSPTFTSPPVTPTQLVRSPLRLYTSRSLTDSDASLESEDSGMRSPGVRSYNTCPRGWSGSLRLKRGAMSEDL